MLISSGKIDNLNTCISQALMGVQIYFVFYSILLRFLLIMLMQSNLCDGTSPEIWFVYEKRSYKTKGEGMLVCDLYSLEEWHWTLMLQANYGSPAYSSALIETLLVSFISGTRSPRTRNYWDWCCKWKVVDRDVDMLAPSEVLDHPFQEGFRKGK